LPPHPCGFCIAWAGMSSHSSGSFRAKTLPPLGSGRALIDLDIVEEGGLSRKVKAEKRDKKWSGRLQRALLEDQTVGNHRRSSVASLMGMEGASQPWWAGFHNIRGELAKAQKLDTNLRRIENRRVTQPTARGLFRTEMLTNDAGEARCGLHLEDWRGTLQLTSDRVAARRSAAAAAAAAARAEAHEWAAPSEPSGSSKQSWDPAPRQGHVMFAAAEPWNEEEDSEPREMTLDQLIDSFDNWLSSHIDWIER